MLLTNEMCRRNSDGRAAQFCTENRKLGPKKSPKRLRVWDFNKFVFLHSGKLHFLLQFHYVFAEQAIRIH